MTITNVGSGEVINRWSCLPKAFAIGMGIELDALIKLIGHDGGAIINDSPEPYCRESFHIQEIIPHCLAFDYAAIMIEKNPLYAMPNGMIAEKNLDHITTLMKSHSGVITGMWTNRPHAAYYHDGIIHDPNGQIYPLTFREINIQTFTILIKFGHRSI